MLFRRTCKLVELEAARKNVEKAKPVKKAAVSVSIKLQNRASHLVCVQIRPAGVSVV